MLLWRGFWELEGLRWRFEGDFGCVVWAAWWNRLGRDGGVGFGRFGYGEGNVAVPRQEFTERNVFRGGSSRLSVIREVIGIVKIKSSAA